MSHDRTFGVTEAGLGLTVLTCLLVTLGYVVLQRVGGTGQPPPIEVRPPASTTHNGTTDGASQIGAEQPLLLPERPQVLNPHDDYSADSDHSLTTRRSERQQASGAHHEHNPARPDGESEDRPISYDDDTALRRLAPLQ